MFIPGKVNLFLKVGEVRPADGRHSLATLFLPLNRLGDDVTVRPGRPGSGIVLRQEGRPIPAVPPERNIAWRAAQAFCQRFGVAAPDWEITLSKALPVSAGLGGGSADAAAVLRQLRDSCKERPSREEMVELALGLGADVPFFLEAVPAYATGAGECLQQVNVTARFGIVVVYPGIPSPVAWAYRHCRENDNSALPGMPEPEAMASAEALARLVDNDLAQALMEKTPALGMIVEAMKAAGCLAATISGSGSSCFGICRPGEAPDICGRIRRTLADMTATEVFWAAEWR